MNDGNYQRKIESLVIQCIETLPDEFKVKLENIDIVIEDYPKKTKKNKGIMLGVISGSSYFRKRILV